MNEKIKARNRMKFKFAVRYLSAFAVYVAVIVGMFFSAACCVRESDMVSGGSKLRVFAFY